MHATHLEGRIFHNSDKERVQESSRERVQERESSREFKRVQEREAKEVNLGCKGEIEKRNRATKRERERERRNAKKCTPHPTNPRLQRKETHT
jgi:hypothetical protein